MNEVSVSAKRAAFRDLHRAGCFVLPNPWDGRTAAALSRAGFKALASTSAGAAWALAKADGEMSLKEVLDHLRFLSSVTDLPVNADFESGFAETPEGVRRNVALCIETGVAGLSIEDRHGHELYSKRMAVERLSAARASIDQFGDDIVLVGRCEAYLIQPLDLDEVIERLRAYSQAGADCLYAPGLTDLASIRAVVAAVDKPVNANLTGTGLSVADMASAGVRRVSVGAALAAATYAAFDDVVEQLKATGRLPDS